MVLLRRGFPECWYSWRHQLSALAAVGFHAIAPNMRGYGQTDAPQEVDRYSLLHLLGDMVRLLDALGIERAVIAGHDWLFVACQCASASCGFEIVGSMISPCLPVLAVNSMT